MPGGITQIPFYGILCRFLVGTSLTERMGNLTVSSHQDQVLRLAVGSNISIQGKGVAFEKEKLSFLDLGGNEKAKSDIFNYTVVPLQRLVPAIWWAL